MNTERIRGICLGMGAASLATVAVILAMGWLLSAIPQQRAPQLEPPNFVARVQSTQSCESLKTLCGNLAAGYDAQHSQIAYLNRSADDILKRIIAFVLVWGVITSAGFFYVAWAIRQYAKGPGVAP